MSIIAQGLKSTTLVVLGAFWALTACNSVKPTAPAASYVSQLTKVTEPSVFNIPIELSIQEIERQLNAKVAATIYEDNSLENNGGDNLIVQVRKRTNIGVTSTNGAISFRVPVAIYVKAGWKIEKFGIVLGKYEDTNFDIDLNFATKVAVGPTWAVSTTTVANGYSWVSKPVIKLGGFEIPITSVVEKILDSQLPTVAKLLDDEVKQNLDLKPYIQKAWNEIQEPFLVNKDYKAWLKIKPEEIIMTPLTTKGTNLRMSLGLKAITESTVGLRPSADLNTKLPPLKTVPSVNERFQVSLMNVVSFATLKDIASNLAVGKTFEDGKRKVTITGLEIYGQDNKLVVAVDLAGSVSGKIFLTGKPSFDASTNQLVIDDLDYSLDTKSTLAKTADWLAHGKFLTMMNPYFKVNVKDQLDEARRLIDQNLNKTVANGVVLKGKLDHFRPDQLRVTEQGVQSMITAIGTLNVMIDGF